MPLDSSDQRGGQLVDANTRKARQCFLHFSSRCLAPCPHPPQPAGPPPTTRMGAPHGQYSLSLMLLHRRVLRAVQSDAPLDLRCVARAPAGQGAASLFRCSACGTLGVRRERGGGAAPARGGSGDSLSDDNVDLAWNAPRVLLVSGMCLPPIAERLLSLSLSLSLSIPPLGPFLANRMPPSASLPITAYELKLAKTRRGSELKWAKTRRGFIPR